MSGIAASPCGSISTPPYLGGDLHVFLPAWNKPRLTPITSNTITVVTGGDVTPEAGLTWSKNGGALSASAGTAVKGDRIYVEVDSSDQYATPVDKTLAIDGNALHFVVTTLEQATFTIPSQNNVEPTTLITSAVVSVTGILSAKIISVANGAYRLNGTGDFITEPSIFNVGDTFEVQRTSGTYEATVSATITIGGVSHDFDITTKAELSTEGMFVQAAFDEGAGQKITNSVNTSEIIGNLLIQGYRPYDLFSLQTWTADASTDVPTEFVDYGYKSDRVQIAAGGYTITKATTINLPASGSYTFGFPIKSNTGGDQTFRFAASGPGLSVTYSANKTATTSWQWFSMTITVTGSGDTRLYITSDSSNNTVDILISKGYMVSGSSLPSFIPRTWDLTLGSSYDLTGDPAWNSYGVNTQGGVKFVSSRSDTALSLTAFTGYFVVRKTGAEYLNNYGPIFDSVRASNPGTFYLGRESTGLKAVFSTLSLASIISTSIYDGNFHVVCMKYDGSYLYIIVDGVTYKSALSAGLSQSIKEFYLSMLNNVAFWPGDISYCRLFSVAHDMTEMVKQINNISSILTARSISVGLSPALVTEGDSITALDTAQGKGYAYLSLVDGFSVPLSFVNKAASGNTLTNATSRADLVDEIYDGRENYLNIISILFGANDLNTVSASTFFSNLTTYIQARKNATTGLKVVVCTILPQTTAGFNDKRNAANTLIRDDTSGLIDVICDFAADATMGPDAAASNTTYYNADGIHPTLVGQQTLMPIYKAAIESLL